MISSTARPLALDDAPEAGAELLVGSIGELEAITDQVYPSGAEPVGVPAIECLERRLARHLVVDPGEFQVRG
jgi:hypothetical protein